MNTLAIRLSLVIPFYDELIVGSWNQLSPRTFYDNFPTVDRNPPFSDHFAHDFGGATMGIALLLGIALVKPRTHYVVPAALAFSIYSVPHFVYHLLNTTLSSPTQTFLLNLAKATVSLLGLAAVVFAMQRDRRLEASATAA